MKKKLAVRLCLSLALVLSIVAGALLWGPWGDVGAVPARLGERTRANEMPAALPSPRPELPSEGKAALDRTAAPLPGSETGAIRSSPLEALVLQGQVTDEQGAALAGAAVSVEFDLLQALVGKRLPAELLPASAGASTGNDGRFQIRWRIGSVVPSAAMLRIRAEGFEPRLQPIPFGLEKWDAGVIRLAAAGAVRGRVLEQGLPAIGLDVALFRESSWSSLDQFPMPRLDGLPRDPPAGWKHPECATTTDATGAFAVRCSGEGRGLAVVSDGDQRRAVFLLDEPSLASATLHLAGVRSIAGVVRSDDGLPAAARIRLLYRIEDRRLFLGEEAHTDEGGGFRLAVRPGLTPEILAEAPGHAHALVALPARDEGPIEVRLTRSRRTTVHVVDAETKAPLEGAKLEILETSHIGELTVRQVVNESQGAVVRPRGSGTFEVDLGTGAGWCLRARCDSYAPRLHGPLGSGLLAEAISIDLARGGAVGGRALRRADGSALAGVAVWLADAQDSNPMDWSLDDAPIGAVFSGADGEFELRGVPKGIYRIRAAAPGLAPWVSEEVHRVQAGLELRVDVELEAAGNLEGVVVVHGEGGDPPYRVSSRRAPDGERTGPGPDEESAITDAQGRFAFRDLAAGDYDLRVLRRVETPATAGHSPDLSIQLLLAYAGRRQPELPLAEERVRIVPGETAWIELEIGRLPQGSCHLYGFVTNWNPEPGCAYGVSVAVRDARKIEPVVPDSSGFFDFGWLPPGMANVHLTQKGDEAGFVYLGSASVLLKAGEEQEVLLEAVSVGRVSFELVADGSGEHVRGAQVFHARSNGQGSGMVLSGGGQTLMAAGDYLGLACAPGYEACLREFQVEAGQRGRAVVFSTRAMEPWRTRLVDDQGEPLADATLLFAVLDGRELPRGLWPSTKTNGQGEFEVSFLRPDVYDVRILAAGKSTLRSASLDLRGKPAQVRLDRDG